MKRNEETLKHITKERDQCEKLNTVKFHVYNIPEKAKLQRQ